jgi:hypothetical protein
MRRDADRDPSGTDGLEYAWVMLLPRAHPTRKSTDTHLPPIRPSSEVKSVHDYPESCELLQEYPVSATSPELPSASACGAYANEAMNMAGPGY